MSSKVCLKIFNPRAQVTGKHRHIDDAPYGGGEGMLMQYEPLSASIKEALAKAKECGHKKPKVVFLSPQGRLFHQKLAKKYAKEDAIILISGCYEGIDERIVSLYVDEEISIGDYILSGGELAIMIFMNVVARLWDSTLGNVNSALTDSFENGLLEEPQYTRPAILAASIDKKSKVPSAKVSKALKVPEILLSGNHKKINQWKRCQSLGRTWVKRPNLLANVELSISDKKLLLNYISSSCIMPKYMQKHRNNIAEEEN